MTEYTTARIANDAETVAALVTALLALDRVIAGSPSYEHAHDASNALEAFLGHFAPGWKEMSAAALAHNSRRIDSELSALNAESMRILTGALPAIIQAIKPMTDEIGTSDRDRDSSLRHQVAVFASWSMGSCHGDSDPRCREVFDEVMAGGETFDFYLPKYIASMDPQSRTSPAGWLDGLN